MANVEVSNGASSLAVREDTRERIDWALDRAKEGLYSFERCLTKVTGTVHFEDVVAALMVELGSRSGAADLLGISRPRLSSYIANRPDLIDLCKEIREGIKDRVEQNVLRKALDGDWQAEKLILTTIARDRGYGPSVVVEDSTSGALVELLKRAGGHSLPEAIDVTEEK